MINRSPSVPLGFDIPERIWSGHDISYSHWKVFGCKALAYVNKEHRQKIDDKAIPCILVGCGDEEFCYRLWDPEKRRIIRSRDVVFHEQETMSNSAIPKKPKRYGKVNLTLTTPPIRVAIEGGDLNEDPRVDGEPVIEYGNDDEDVEDEEQSPTYQLRRSNRDHQPSTRYPSSEYILITNEGEPKSFDEVQTHMDKIQWMKAMQEEMDSLQKNDTYELLKLPEGRKALKNKWLFKLKKDGDKLVK